MRLRFSSAYNWKDTCTRLGRPTLAVKNLPIPSRLTFCHITYVRVFVSAWHYSLNTNDPLAQSSRCPLQAALSARRVTIAGVFYILRPGQLEHELFGYKVRARRLAHIEAHQACPDNPWTGPRSLGTGQSACVCGCKKEPTGGRSKFQFFQPSENDASAFSATLQQLYACTLRNKRGRTHVYGLYALVWLCVCVLTALTCTYGWVGPLKKYLTPRKWGGELIRYLIILLPFTTRVCAHDVEL